MNNQNLVKIDDPNTIVGLVRQFKDSKQGKLTFQLIRANTEKPLTSVDYAYAIDSALRKADRKTREEIWNGLVKRVQYTVLYPDEEFDIEIFRLLGLEIEYIHRAYNYTYSLSRPVHDGWSNDFSMYDSRSGYELVKILTKLTPYERLLFFQTIDPRILFNIIIEEIKDHNDMDKEINVAIIYNDVVPHELYLLNYIQREYRSVADRLKDMFVGYESRDYLEARQAKFELDERNRRFNPSDGSSFDEDEE